MKKWKKSGKKAKQMVYCNTGEFIGKLFKLNGKVKDMQTNRIRDKTQ